ncbi:MAG TPA: NAD-dependent epimerase/dehydratase family protein [Chitinophagaceae bacterium]|jgi:nucleoside-diphosphate-sugar epimerase
MPQAANTIIEEDAGIINGKVDFTALQNKTILITGASGLLGIYFLTCLGRLAEQGMAIKVVAVFRSELPPYLAGKGFTGMQICRGDITDYEFCRSLPEADYIIHAAGYGQPMKFMESPEKTLKLNTFSTFLLFDKLRPGGHFMFVSSSEVYSGLSRDVYTEDEIGSTNTTHPRACYIEGKRGGEAICNAYRSKNVKASSVRLAHTYGPGTKKGDKRVILSFIEKALAGKIEMIDKGEAVRTYCYVADAVEIMWKILLSAKEPVYNVGGNSQTTIANLAHRIGAIMSVPVIMPTGNEGVAGAPKDVKLDMQKVAGEFGKTQYISLEEGLQRTIKWYLTIHNQ